MNHGFIWCPHCGKPHTLDEKFCPSTGDEMAPGLHQRSRAGLLRTRISTPSSPNALVGVVLDAKYRLIRRIGMGGMGEVFEAENLASHRLVAIKVVAERDSGEGAKRLQREALALAAIYHPNICDLHDVGSLPSGYPYLVFERLVGETLDQRLSRKRLSPRTAISVFSQLLSALQAAHAVGIIHRDLKPSNVFLVDCPGRRAQVKVLDFGLAKKVSGDVWRSITRKGHACGTPDYMSPEQLRARPVDARSDLFSVGLVLFEALTGRHPFRTGATVETCIAVMRDATPHLRSVRPSLPEALDRVVRRALEKDPDRRFATAMAMLNALANSVADDGEWNSSTTTSFVALPRLDDSPSTPTPA